MWDSWNDAILDLDRRDSELQDVVSNNKQAWVTATQEQADAALNWIQKVGYRNQLQFLILSAFTQAYIASGTYNVTKSNAQKSQIKTKGVATFYPSLPEPWNMVLVIPPSEDDVPTDDRPGYNPDIPEPEEEDYSQTQE